MGAIFPKHSRARRDSSIPMSGSPQIQITPDNATKRDSKICFSEGKKEKTSLDYVRYPQDRIRTRDRNTACLRVLFFDASMFRPYNRGNCTRQEHVFSCVFSTADWAQIREAETDRSIVGRGRGEGGDR